MAQLTLERRRLNEEIEDSFIIAAQAASNVDMKLFSGKGNVSGDLQDFYNHFNYLVRLTSQLREMEPKDEKDPLATLKVDTERWMQQRTAGLPAARLEVVARTGLKLFDKYYHTLMHVGIISLPTRKG